MSRPHRLQRADGFTLVEVLVVVLLIGILAAIALPRFLGQQAKAQDADAQQAARALAAHVESCFAERENYALCDTAAEVPGTGLDWGTGPGQVAVHRNVLPGVVGVAATSETGSVFAVARSLGTRRTSRVCFVPSGAYPTGQCRSGGGIAGFGTWG